MVIWTMSEAVATFAAALLLFTFAMSLTVERSWWATDIGPQFLTEVPSIALWDIIWSIDDLLCLNLLVESEEFFLGLQDMTNIMFD